MAELRLLTYLAAITLPTLLITNLFNATPDFTGSLQNKVQSYRMRAAEFDAVFLGDSRAYCAIHPHRLADALAIKSVNLASWAHWLPTQYSQIVDIIDYIPQHTTVIWSVGLQNFTLCQGCETLAYPIGKANAEFYADIGLPPSLYEKNIRTLSPVKETSDINKYDFSVLYTGVVKWFNKPIYTTNSDLSDLRETDLERPSVDDLLAKLRSRGHVAETNIVYADNKPTSIESTFKLGGYERIELDPEFFRRMQALDRVKRTSPANVYPNDQNSEQTEISLAYLALFEAGLDLFAERGLRVIVNVFEEAPYTYTDDAEKTHHRALMNRQVREVVESRGFTFVSVDFDQIASENYFDYNHLNNTGVDTFTSMFVQELSAAGVGQPKQKVATHAL